MPRRPIRSLRACLPALALAACTAGGGGGADDPGAPPTGLAPDLTPLAAYDVTGGELGSPTLFDVEADLEADRDDTDTHAELWAFARPALTSHLKWIGSFVVFTDGADGTLAQVFPLDDDPKRWALALDLEDAFDANGELGGDEFSATIVHEFAHIVALNADQVTFDPELAAAGDDDGELLESKAAACDTYFLDEGCAREDAYILAFHEAFWVDLADEEAAMADQSEEEGEAAAEALYARFPDRFVSEYAATDATEDFAESFAHFVLLPTPEGDDERDEKVRFFAEFPELVAIRQGIRAAGLRAESLGDEE